MTSCGAQRAPCSPIRGAYVGPVRLSGFPLPPWIGHNALFVRGHLLYISITSGWLVALTIVVAVCCAAADADGALADGRVEPHEKLGSGSLQGLES